MVSFEASRFVADLKSHVGRQLAFRPQHHKHHPYFQLQSNLISNNYEPNGFVADMTSHVSRQIVFRPNFLSNMPV